MTVLEILKRTTEYFQKHQVESPRLNIEHLTAKVLGCGRMDLYMQFDRALGEDELTALRELVKRRVAGEPLQHLLGDVEFLGQLFNSDARALIPRPETELLAETILRRYGPPDALKPAYKPKAVPLGEAPAAPPAPEESAAPAGPVVRLLDLCTGTGVIALSLAKYWVGAEVTATDLSPEALALAGENAAKLGLAGRATLLQGDLWHALPPGTPRFHGIISNPPYIPTGALPHLQREVLHDPHLALDGGADGLDLVREIIQGAPNHLEPGGWLALEIGHDQAAAVRALMEDAGFGQVEVIQDYQDIGRFVIGVRV